MFKQNLSKEDKIQELEERNERLVQIIKNMEELPVVNEMIRLEKVSKELEKLLRMALNRIDSTWHERLKIFFQNVLMKSKKKSKPSKKKTKV